MPTARDRHGPGDAPATDRNARSDAADRIWALRRLPRCQYLHRFAEGLHGLAQAVTRSRSASWSWCRPQGTGCGRRGSSPWPVSRPSGRRCPDRGRRRNGRGSGPTHLGCTSPYGTATTCRSSPRIDSSASRVTLIRDRAGVVERRMIQLHPRQLSSPPTTGAVLGPRRVLPPRLGFRLLGVQRERP
jgi:hypothetical protein